MSFDPISTDLRDRDQWVCWRVECEECKQVLEYGTETCTVSDCDGDSTKVPVVVGGGYRASSTDSDTWSTFEEAVSYHNRDETDTAGLGFVFDEDGTVAGVDLDDVRDPETGQPTDTAKEIIERLDSYTEVSPSGTGYHIYAHGFVIGRNRDDFEDAAGHIEMYDRARYFTVTGDHVQGTPDTVNQRANALNDVHGDYVAENDTDDTNTATEPTPDSDLDDGELIKKAKSADNGDKFRRLWSGDTSGYESHSEADMALCSLLAFWTGGDRQQIDDLFRQSGLMRDKWERDDYRDRTIKKAVKGRSEFYNPEQRTDGGTQTSTPTPDRGPTIDDDTDAIDLNPIRVIERAGYDSDDVDLSDLRNDEIAYTVAEMIDASDDVYFRWVNDDTTALYAYDDGVWTPNADNRLREVLHRALRHRNSQRMASESEHAIKSRPTLKIERDHLGAPDGTVAVKNGLLDLRDRTVRELRPEDMALNRIQAEYHSTADYDDTRWMEFLEESVREDDLKKLQEYAGYTLWQHAQPFGKALFLIGPTDAGKGVFLDIIEEILGEDNVASQSLYNLMQSRFGTANLFGKMANIRNEVTAGGLKNVEAFKELTGGGDRISAERKNQDPFKFKVTQKFLFSTNQVPSIEHADEAFFNRLLFVKFPETVPDEEQNPSLADELLEEKPAILNWMLDGLDRLLTNEQFSSENDTDDKRDIIDAWGNLADRFKHNLLEVTGDTAHVVHKSDLYDLFNDYGDYLDKPNDMAQSTFTKEMKSEPGISDGQSRAVDGEDERPRVYKGLRVNADSVEEIGADMPRHDYGDGEPSQSRL